MNNKKNIVLMAFSKGSESTEGVAFKKYIGIAPVTVLAVNPNKEELNKLYNTELDKEPEYLSEKDGVKQCRIDFIVKTVAEKCDGIDIVSKITFFLSKNYRFNKDETKVEVIDKYGRTAWATKEECNNHTIPVYANGPANIDKDFKPAYNGLVNLITFMKTYLGIPNVQKYIDNKWVMVDKPEECECSFENVDKFFEGNFKELKEIISYQPNNKIKVMFGVKTSDDGKEYQTVYTNMFAKNNVTDYSKIDKDLQERKQNGAFANVEFSIEPLHEYIVTPTDFEKPAEQANNNWFNN